MNKGFWDWSIEQKEKYGIYGFDIILWMANFILLGIIFWKLL